MFKRKKKNEVLIKREGPYCWGVYGHFQRKTIWTHKNNTHKYPEVKNWIDLRVGEQCRITPWNADDIINGSNHISPSSIEYGYRNDFGTSTVVLEITNDGLRMWEA